MAFTYNGFIHLRLHSAYSLTEGAILMENIPPLCHTHHMPAVAITDSNNMFGALEFSELLAKNGVQPIMGCELSIRYTANQPDTSMVLLVQSEQGYKNLLKLSSQLYMNSEPFLTLQDLFPYTDGLICLTGGANGPLGHCLLAERDTDCPQSRALLETLISYFPNRLYIELHRHHTAPQKILEPLFLKLAIDYQVPLVATNNVFFATKDMYDAHDSLLCIAAGTYIDEENRRKETPHHYFKSSAEMMQLFNDLPEAIHNTVLIAKRCHYRPLPHSPILPRFQDPHFNDEIEALTKLSQQGLLARFDKDIVYDKDAYPQILERYQQRLAYEIDIITKMGFCGYFLIVSDFIRWAKSQKIPVGPGRGSGAGSLVAYSLSITDMDPLRFNLIFERFLNPERVSMPDFDVDFCQDRRDEVIAYVSQKYGSDKVAHIITFGKFQARMVIRDVGRVLQMSYPQVDRICKMIPNNPANPVTLRQAIEGEPLLQDMQKEDHTIQKLMTIGCQLEGLYRHASTHAAGIVIGDRPLDEWVPLYRDEKSELLVTQFSMKYAEAAGLVKFDFLGLKTLTVIDYCCRLVEKTTGTPLDITTIPLDDPNTFALLCRVETVGLFQLESPGMRDVLRRLQPDRFEDIIALVALYRPGPMDDIPRYLACKHGLEPVTYPHPLVEEVLKETYGVMVYQEQVMQIAQILGGYTLGAADLLRRAMGKKIKSEMDAQRAIFMKGATEKGLEAPDASAIFDAMAKFAGYGFNKSHSAPYALLAYQTAYLKANHPLEFFASLMSYDRQNVDKLNVYRNDLNRLNIPLFPPDINQSHVEFTVETQLETKEKGIRYALSALKNVGTKAMESLLEERHQRGPFQNLNDYAKRTDPRAINKRQLENLIAAGAFDSLTDGHRKGIHDAIDTLLNASAALKKETRQKSLFAAQESPLMTVDTSTADWTPLERLQKEFDALGFYMTSHPLSLYQDVIKQLPITHSHQFLMEATFAYTTVTLVGVVLSKTERTSKKGDNFAFVHLTDLHGIFEICLFNDVYKMYQDLVVPGSPLLITASLKKQDEEVYRLIGKTVENLNEVPLRSHPAAVAAQPREITLHLTQHQIPEIIKVLTPLKQQSGVKQHHDVITLMVTFDSIGTLKIILSDTFTLTDALKKFQV